mmetsp:Transcript_34179/g.58035  ORF Transcript_34179/g.58035 Transcript_34179/m.58035 type:complete len:107 (-) Transcript_34179:1257-1577(-)
MIHCFYMPFARAYTVLWMSYCKYHRTVATESIPAHYVHILNDYSRTEDSSDIIEEAKSPSSIDSSESGLFAINKASRTSSSIFFATALFPFKYTPALNRPCAKFES